MFSKNRKKKKNEGTCTDVIWDFNEINRENFIISLMQSCYWSDQLHITFFLLNG